jgi:hypothetical protein
LTTTSAFTTTANCVLISPKKYAIFRHSGLASTLPIVLTEDVERKEVDRQDGPTRVAENQMAPRREWATMNIGPVSLSAQQLSSNKWRLTVRYTASFSPQEVNPPLNFDFRDGFQIWEDDPVMMIRSQDTWRSRPSTRHADLTHDISGDDLDTELGGEEIKVRVRLRNVSLNFPIHRWSGTIGLAP